MFTLETEVCPLVCSRQTWSNVSPWVTHTNTGALKKHKCSPLAAYKKRRRTLNSWNQVTLIYFQNISWTPTVLFFSNSVSFFFMDVKVTLSHAIRSPLTCVSKLNWWRSEHHSWWGFATQCEVNFFCKTLNNLMWMQVLNASYHFACINSPLHVDLICKNFASCLEWTHH